MRRYILNYYILMWSMAWYMLLNLLTQYMYLIFKHKLDMTYFHSFPNFLYITFHYCALRVLCSRPAVNGVELSVQPDDAGPNACLPERSLHLWECLASPLPVHALDAVRWGIPDVKVIHGRGLLVVMRTSRSSIFCLIVWTFQTSVRGFTHRQTLSIYLLRSLAIKFYQFESNWSLWKILNYHLHQTINSYT